MFDALTLRLIHYIIALGAFVRQWIFRMPAISYRHRVESTAQSDARQLKKLPLHLSLVVLENEISYEDIASAILWSAVFGISYISVYDTNGILKRNSQVLYEAIAKYQKISMDTEKSEMDIRLHSSLDRSSKIVTNSSHIDVYLLSLEDGRQSLVDLTQTLCKRVKAKQYRPSDISTQSVDALLQEQSHFPDPDLIVKFGQVDSLLGFMPWQIRLTEILSLPSHIGLDYKSFKSIISSYGDTTQRFGK